MSEKINEQELAAYAATVEKPSNKLSDTIEMPQESSNIKIGNAAHIKKFDEEIKTAVNANKEKTLDEIQDEHRAALRQEAIDKGVAIVNINVEDLPSKGLFYPKGTQIFINAARLSDIKRWTSMDEGDVADITDKIKNIIESCAVVSFGNSSSVRGSWKDIIDIDRLYILFAIHDRTFKPGDNDIVIKINEKDNTILRKENVRFMEFSDKIMKYYNDELRCFEFPVRNTEAFKKTNGKMRIYMTTLGVADFIMDYVRACEARQDNYDRDFVTYAALLLGDWRGLTLDKYYDLIESTRDWGTYEWSLISKVKDLLAASSFTPMLKYKDNGGAEREVPLNFRNGIKAMFLQNLDIDL